MIINYNNNDDNDNDNNNDNSNINSNINSNVNSDNNTHVNTSSPPIKSLYFRGFDSSRLLIPRGGNSHVR